MDKGNLIRHGSIVFTKAEIFFCDHTDKNNSKMLVYIHGTCSDKEDVELVEIIAVLTDSNRYCSNCHEDIFWFISKAEVEIINYLPASNELVVRIKVVCECGVVKEVTLLLSLEKDK